MKAITIISILLILITGCVNNNVIPSQTASDLILNNQDLTEIGLVGYNCLDGVEGFFDNSRPETYCPMNYSIVDLNNTNVFVIITKYDTFENLNGSYQYESSHYFSKEGLISENTYGEMSRFRLSNENDYGGTEPGIFIYHLWIVQDPFMIHITSKGDDAKEEIIAIAQKVLTKTH